MIYKCVISFIVTDMAAPDSTPVLSTLSQKWITLPFQPLPSLLLLHQT